MRDCQAYWIIIALAVFCSLLCVANSQAPYADEIIPGGIMLDEQGERIWAGGGSLLQGLTNDTYYWWYGEQEKTDNVSDHGINCYSSTDLLHWKYMGASIDQDDIAAGASFPGPYVVERPRVLYNSHTLLYVMWFHLDDLEYKQRQVGVAVSAEPWGNFTFLYGFQPDGVPSLDQTLFYDKQNDLAYFIRSANNTYVAFSQLTDDYLNTTGICSTIPEPREGPAMFRYASTGHLYLVTSHLTGWDPNAQELFIGEKSVCNTTQWISLGNPTSSSTTYNSQSTFVLPYERPDGAELYIYMGDRWNYNTPDGLWNATYVWLPYTFNSPTNVTLDWYDNWPLWG